MVAARGCEEIAGSSSAAWPHAKVVMDSARGHTRYIRATNGSSLRSVQVLAATPDMTRL
jgi:hypothetical protein